MKTNIFRAILAIVVALLTVTLNPRPVAADPTQSYSWGSYTVDANSTDSFTIAYNGGEWADAKAVPDNSDDNIDMKVYDTFGILNASDTEHVSPHCHWWVGLLYSTESFTIKIINNCNYAVHYQFRPY